MSKENKPKNRMYQLYELRDSLIDAIENMKKVIKQNGLLVESVLNSKNKDTLKEFTQALVEDCKAYTKRIDEYTERLEKVKYVIDLYQAKDEKSEFVSKIVTTVLEALGLGAEEQNYPTRA